MSHAADRAQQMKTELTIRSNTIEVIGDPDKGTSGDGDRSDNLLGES